MVFELPPRESSWRGRESKRERVRVIGVFIMKMMQVSKHSPDAIKFCVGKWSCRSQEGDIESWYSTFQKMSELAVSIRNWNQS
jgi:hypothetical protein